MIKFNKVHAVGFGTLTPNLSPHGDFEKKFCNIDENNCLLAKLLLRISLALLSKHMILPYSCAPHKNSKDFFSSAWIEYYPQQKSRKEQINYALSCIKVSIELSVTYTLLERVPLRGKLYCVKKLFRNSA